MLAAAHVTSLRTISTRIDVADALESRVLALEASLSEKSLGISQQLSIIEGLSAELATSTKTISTLEGEKGVCVDCVA